MCTIEKLNPSGEVKILEKDKYIVNDTEDELDRLGVNYQGYIINLDENDIIDLYALGKNLVFNIEGEYAVVLRYKNKPIIKECLNAKDVV